MDAELWWLCGNAGVLKSFSRDHLLFRPREAARHQTLPRMLADRFHSIWSGRKLLIVLVM